MSHWEKQIPNRLSLVKFPAKHQSKFQVEEYTHLVRTVFDVPYPTTKSPLPLPPTTHLALNVCEALRRPSLCEAGDVKDEDKLVHLAFGLFSGKQLRAVMCLELRKQKPLSNALDGSYLLCEEHMLRTQWKGGYAGTLSRQASS